MTGPRLLTFETLGNQVIFIVLFLRLLLVFSEKRRVKNTPIFVFVKDSTMKIVNLLLILGNSFASYGRDTMTKWRWLLMDHVCISVSHSQISL